jgi:prophage antirepressor-like protein
MRGSPAAIIVESGLYKLIMRAQRSNPLARAFQDWVTREVLPAMLLPVGLSVDCSAFLQDIA